MSEFRFFSSFVGWGTEPGRRHLTRPTRTRVREKDQVTAYKFSVRHARMYSSLVSDLIFRVEYFWLNGIRATQIILVSLQYATSLKNLAVKNVRLGFTEI